MAAAVDIPVGAVPADVAGAIRISIQAGVVGGNTEDNTDDARAPRYEGALAVERSRAARDAADRSGIAYTLIGRTGCYLINAPNLLAVAVSRANLCRKAGADCLFVPGIKDARSIAALAHESGGPMKVVMGLTGALLSVAALQALGVRRISIGGSRACATFGPLRQAAREMRAQGTSTCAQRQIPDSEVRKFLASWDRARRFV